MTTPTAQQRLAAAIRATYRAGVTAGRWAWPHIHAIDWAEARAVFRAGLAVLVAAVITAGQLAIPALCAASERLGRAYAAWLVPNTARPAAAAPAVPVAVTTTTAAEQVQPAPAAAPVALEALPVKALRQLARQAGHKALARSGRRADLLQVLAA